MVVSRSGRDTGVRDARLRDVPAFRRFWAAYSVSIFGDYVTTLAIQVVVVLTLDGGATQVGLVSAARWLPYLLLGIMVGAVVDRVRRRPLIIATDLARGVLLLVIPALAATGELTLGLLMAVMCAFGFLSVIDDAASQAFLARVTPTPLLTQGLARLDQSEAVAQTSGPALAGVLVGVLTAPWAVVVDAASYLFSGVTIWRTPVEEPPSRPIRTPGLLRESLQGLSYVYRHRMLTPYALATHGWFLCNAVAGVVLAPFTLHALGLPSWGLAVALAVSGAGGLLGSLSAVALGSRFGAGRVVIAAQAACGVAWALVALTSADWPGLAFLGLGQFLLGAAMGAMNANEMGYRQTITPDRLQGRMNATMRSMNRAMIVVGAPLGGVLADAIGLRTALVVAAVGFVAVALALLASPYRAARVPAAPGG